VCEMYSQMFKKYLLKNDFWMTRAGEEPCFIKHDPVYGGIYARVMPKGVEIQFNNERLVFENFNELDDFLDRVSLHSNTASNDYDQFSSIITRKMTSKLLRTTLPI
jgi:hypothetical protein